MFLKSDKKQTGPTKKTEKTCDEATKTWQKHCWEVCSNRSPGVGVHFYITLPHATVIDVSLDITSYHGGELVLFSRTVSWRMLIRHTSTLTGIFRPITIL